VPELDCDDVRICSTNTVKALGWQGYYDGLRAGQKGVAPGVVK
jgi:hypothetical protein